MKPVLKQSKPKWHTKVIKLEKESDVKFQPEPVNDI